jgi:hypothetical protein
MDEIPFTVSGIRNDGESVRFSLRGDDGHLSSATIPCERMNDILNTLIQGFIIASVRATNQPSQENIPSDFRGAPQTFRATDIQLTGDLNSGDTFLVMPTREQTELLIILQPHLLTQLIDLASQRKDVQPVSDATN